jgi:hypothetical protein
MPSGVVPPIGVPKLVGRVGSETSDAKLTRALGGCLRPTRLHAIPIAAKLPGAVPDARDTQVGVSKVYDLHGVSSYLADSPLPELEATNDQHLTLHLLGKE